MKLLIEDDGGRQVEVREAVSVEEGGIVLLANSIMKTEDVKKIENEMKLKFGRKVIVLDARFKGILTIPPIKEE